jgi:hypothetical protein
MIHGKSSHPVEVKKISVRIWSLRSEIEAAIERRMKECEAAGVPLYIDDIKRIYNMNLDASLTDATNVLQFNKTEGKDGVADLMESAQEAAPVDVSPESNPDNSTLEKADEVIAEQKVQGIDNKPNPILERPYVRQAPDLDKISYGFCLLSDINMQSILLFTKDKFLFGQSVVIEFLIPQNFIMTADVVYCNHYAIRSRVISTTKPDYRVQCKFSFSVSGERDHLRNFLKSIEPTLTKKASQPKEDDSLGV